VSDDGSGMLYLWQKQGRVAAGTSLTAPVRSSRTLQRQAKQYSVLYRLTSITTRKNPCWQSDSIIKVKKMPRLLWNQDHYTRVRHQFTPRSTWTHSMLSNTISLVRTTHGLG
jgi:hypothetical protein